MRPTGHWRPVGLREPLIGSYLRSADETLLGRGVPRRAYAPRPAGGLTPCAHSLLPCVANPRGCFTKPHHGTAGNSKNHCKAYHKSLLVVLLYFAGERRTTNCIANTLLLLCFVGCRGPARWAVHQSAQQNSCLLYVLMCFCKRCTAAEPEPE